MKDPERLLQGGSLHERELLATASSDAGSDAAYRRVQQVIGAAAFIGGASSSSAATGALGAGKVKAGASLLFGKWLVVGATAGTVVAGSAYMALGPDRSVVQPASRSAISTPLPSPTATASPAASAGARVAAPESPAARPLAVPSHAREAPALRARRELAPGEGPTPVVPGADIEDRPSTPARSLAEEVRLVDVARAALGGGDPRAALAALARHRAEFPSGALQVEVSVLGVRALLAAGRRAEAESEGSRVLAAHPTGPYAERVRALLAGREKP